jgi:hypothetical protein
LGFVGWLALPCCELEPGLRPAGIHRGQILDAYGWSHFNISWLWYLLPTLLLVRIRLTGKARAAQPPLPRRGLGAAVYGVRGH